MHLGPLGPPSLSPMTVSIVVIAPCGGPSGYRFRGKGGLASADFDRCVTGAARASSKVLQSRIAIRGGAMPHRTSAHRKIKAPDGPGLGSGHAAPLQLG